MRRRDPSQFVIPGYFWDRRDVHDALAGRDIATLFRLVGRYAEASQSGIGIRTGLSQPEVSKIIHGPRVVKTTAVFTRIADGLGMPDHARVSLGLASSVPAVPTRSASLMRAVSAIPLPELGSIAAEGIVGPTAPDDVDDIQDAVVWIADTNASNDAIDQIRSATVYLAEAHTKVAAKRVLAAVLTLHKQVHELLRGGKQRLRQTRDLLRIDSDLLAHASLLLGDLGRDRAAAEYGIAALLFAREAESSEAVARSVQAKTARWQGRYVESAELARRGFEASAPTPTRVELAYREANAIALFGDSGRAIGALRRADQAADELAVTDRRLSVWSFPVERQAVFALSVAIHTGDPGAALRAVAVADAGWNSGDPQVPATWAQVRVGAGIAHLMTGALDGAAEQIAPVLDLPAELRIGTVIGYLRHVDRLLTAPYFANSETAVELRHKIGAFNAATPMGGYATASG